MKTKILCLLLAGCLLALAAWFVRTPAPAQADDVPEKYRDTVQKGLEYLVKNQCRDGHWEGDDGQHPVAMTGLVGLALLMEREVPRGRPIPGLGTVAKYADNIRRASDWLMDKSQAGRDGLIFSDHASETTRYMEGHGVATLFLAGVLRSESDEVRRKRLADVLQRAVKYIVKAQSSQGGWYHTSKVEGHDFDDITATVIQIQALQAAQNAGISVPEGVINDSQEYLKKSLAKAEKDAKNEQNSRRPTETAAALAARSKTDPFGRPRQDELSNWWLKYCQTAIPVGQGIQFGRHLLTHFYYAQGVFSFGGETWTKYRTAMFDQLQGSQNKDGSWPTGSGLGVGQVYSTALWCIVLQLDKGSYPSIAPLPTIITSRKLETWPGSKFAMKSVAESKA